MLEEQLSSENTSKLDAQAKELGVGGKYSPENDESLYKKRKQQRKDIQSKGLK